MEDTGGDEEWQQRYEGGVEEDDKGFDEVPGEIDCCSEVNLWEGVYSEGSFVDDVQVEAEQACPDNEKGEQVAAHGPGYEEFETD